MVMRPRRAIDCGVDDDERASLVFRLRRSGHQLERTRTGWHAGGDVGERRDEITGQTSLPARKRAGVVAWSSGGTELTITCLS